MLLLNTESPIELCHEECTLFEYNIIMRICMEHLVIIILELRELEKKGIIF